MGYVIPYKTTGESIPEPKSMGVYDSDVELEGLLPEEIGDEIEQVAATGSEEDSLADFEPPSPLDEEENDFTTGLAFPTIHNSESSDDEFDLRVQKNQEPKRRMRRQREAADDGAAPEVPAPEPARRRNGGPQSFDDEFEVLQ
ncbi:hypothetical protein Y032_0776g2268 [Ancylostoma ceylanicum]|uniref:Uncharacterized protein n=1 Tax=Ancylostoma ceylanicum TaxID=53326 RepID=A0A016WCS9_9BILA|nr:hypothetical protein Y032_0776g2268 [Ancylostoma ceylanicum]